MSQKILEELMKITKYPGHRAYGMPQLREGSRIPKLIAVLL
jgi:hypothetical protein